MRGSKESRCDGSPETKHLENKIIAAIKPRPAFLPILRMLNGVIEFDETRGLLVTEHWCEQNRRASDYRQEYCVTGRQVRPLLRYWFALKLLLRVLQMLRLYRRLREKSGHLNCLA